VDAKVPEKTSALPDQTCPEKLSLLKWNWQS
jgi:hypothetical protein